MLTLVFLLFVLAIPAFAFDASTMQSVERYCQATTDPAHCLTSWKDEARRFKQANEREEVQRTRVAPAVAYDPLPLMAFMWMFPQPIYRPQFLPLTHSHWGDMDSVRFSAPLNCQSVPFGNGVNTSCY